MKKAVIQIVNGRWYFNGKSIKDLNPEELGFVDQFFNEFKSEDDVSHRKNQIGLILQFFSNVGHNGWTETDEKLKVKSEFMLNQNQINALEDLGLQGTMSDDPSNQVITYVFILKTN